MSDAGVYPPSKPQIGMGAPRFRVHCYVGEDGPHSTNVEGWATLGDIVSRSPLSCRFAVVEAVDHKFQAFDLEDGTVWSHAPHQPKWTADAPEPLIMKALALYGR